MQHTIRPWKLNLGSKVWHFLNKKSKLKVKQNFPGNQKTLRNTEEET